jgi:hypothetical protein
MPKELLGDRELNSLMARRNKPIKTSKASLLKSGTNRFWKVSRLISGWLIISIWVGAAQLFGFISRLEMMAIDGLNASTPAGL